MIMRTLIILLAATSLVVAEDSTINGTWVFDAEQTVTRTLRTLQQNNPQMTREQFIEQMKTIQQGFVISDKKLVWQLGKSSSDYTVAGKWDDGQGDIYLRGEQPNPVVDGKLQKVFHFTLQKTSLAFYLLVGDGVIITCYTRKAQ